MTSSLVRPQPVHVETSPNVKGLRHLILKVTGAADSIPRRLDSLAELGAQCADALLLSWELGLESAHAPRGPGHRALALGQLARLEQIGEPLGPLGLELAATRLGRLLSALLDQ